MTASSIYLVLAEAVARAPESHEQQLLDIDGTVFLQFGLFLLTMFALTQLLWKPYLRVRGERSTRIDGYKEEAKRLDADAAARLTKVEAELGQARRAGSAERTRVRAAAQVKEQEIIKAAQETAQKAIADARARVEAALRAERSNLESRADKLGREAAEKVLGRKVA